MKNGFYNGKKELPEWIKNVIDINTPIEFDGKRFHLSGRFTQNGKQINREIFGKEIEKLGGFFHMGKTEVIQANYFVLGSNNYHENQGNNCRIVIENNEKKSNSYIPIILQTRVEEAMLEHDKKIQPT